jgi:hypothetical protein
MNSLDSDLFQGETADNESLQERWKRMVQTWGGSVIVGSVGRVFVLCGQKVLNVQIPRSDPVSLSYRFYLLSY